jgi:hypothetical protein
MLFPVVRHSKQSPLACAHAVACLLWPGLLPFLDLVNQLLLQAQH